MTRKWGSCSTSGIITLASDLAEQQPGFQDFVIVYELLHLRVPNHGKLLKALMSVPVPAWREHNMKKRGYRLLRTGDGDAVEDDLLEQNHTGRDTLPV